MDWAPGDLALCVKGGTTIKQLSGDTSQAGPIAGKLYTVDAVKRFPEYDGWIVPGDAALGLKIDGFVGWLWAGYFRKIAPHTPDAEDAETIFQLVYAPSPVFTNQIGGTAPVAAPSPEAANNGSGRGAGICLGAPPLSQTLDNARGRNSDSHGFTAPLSRPFHGDD